MRSVLKIMSDAASPRLPFASFSHDARCVCVADRGSWCRGKCVAQEGAEHEEDSALMLLTWADAQHAEVT